jgi:CheY-like chemotaxis protein
VVKTLEELAAEKRQSLVKHYQDLPLFYVDEVRARQVILNGLANMIKFTAPEKPIQLSGFYDVMRNQIVITMRAMSGGISSADAFKFTQAIQATEDLPSAQFADFGLGLAVSKRLVELHGGRISFDSASSTLQISFPAALEPRRPPTMTTAAMIPNDSRPRILVIDDNLESLEVLQGYLQSADYQVYGALSGHEGLLRAREIQPHLILLDMRMPGMDGWAVLDHLQADERLSHIPLIVMSVTDQQHVIRQVDSVRHAMLKPINRTQLLKNVEKILGVSSALPTQA